jgi:hypothetical protein
MKSLLYEADVDLILYSIITQWLGAGSAALDGIEWSLLSSVRPS